MIKKILTFIFSICLVCNAFLNTITSVKAVESPVMNDVSENTEKSQKQDSLYKGAIYNVSQNNFDSVIEGIKLFSGTDVVIVLNEDISATSDFGGIEGKHITLKSTEGNCFSINLGNEIVGDITLDNITAYNSYSNIYANGHLFETTANFHSKKDYSGKETIDKLFGGGAVKVTLFKEILI